MDTRLSKTRFIGEALKNGWEKISIDYWAKLTKISKVIFDIGANTGIYSLVAKTINPNADVYAFEPSKRVFEKLVDNCRINNYNIHAEQTALSNTVGETIFYDTYSKHQYSASLSSEMKDALVRDNVKINQYQVNVKTLKAVIEEHQIDRIDLIKLDVEMHEVEVLEGFGHYLDKFRPTFLIEILSDELAKRIAPHFNNKGYLYFSIDEETTPLQIPSLEKSKFHNLLICQEAVAKRLGVV